MSWLSNRIRAHLLAKFTRPQKQPIHDTIIHEDDDMAEVEDDDKITQVEVVINDNVVDRKEVGDKIIKEGEVTRRNVNMTNLDKHHLVFHPQ
ncbi:hypothetical protein LR48_Vigan715s000500 [Vigna angularis]|uniref:Uncharacterized protein n=1 Tax=Phaseolus angularis TaxID=3914 RepID=A0A0L9TFZ2_PHAAN|nr:hypothetical protein LR48_Vigan715s000500 [Vigna angularis]